MLSGPVWSLLALLVAAGLLTWGVVRRMQKPRGGSTGGFVFAVLAILLMLGQGGAVMLATSIHHAFTLPRYQAVVFDHSTHISTSRDEDGRERRTLMYTPLLRFVDAQGRTLELPGDMASSSAEPIGQTLSIGHRPGMAKAELFTAGKWMMLAGLTLMLCIMVYVLAGACIYAAGWPTARYLSLGAGGLMYGLIPGGMLFMLWGLAYHGVYRHLAGERTDMPAWAFWVCVFFSVVLAMSLWAYGTLIRDRASRPGRRFF